MHDAALVFLNGSFAPAANACISVLDRGFLFGDGVYEVIPAYGGRLLRLEQHLGRLERSLRAIRMQSPHPRSRWREILTELIQRNGGEDRDLAVYLQVTRGVAPRRDHAFPDPVRPTVFAMTMPVAPLPTEPQERAVAAKTVSDTRWDHCDIKATALLANVLLKQEALDRGAGEAILVRGGLAVEGSASNLFAVLDGTVLTPPEGPELLPGITRGLVLELAADNGITCREAPIPAADLGRAEEIWVTSSTREVVPVTRLNGRPVGNGRPGPVWARINGLYQAYKQDLRRGLVS